MLYICSIVFFRFRRLGAWGDERVGLPVKGGDGAETKVMCRKEMLQEKKHEELTELEKDAQIWYLYSSRY